MEKVSHMDVKFMWGNSNYDYVFSEAAGNSGGILCIWEESFFKKDYVTISDSFVAIYGTWIPSKTKLLVVSIYAPQQPSLRRVLWEYLLILLGRWNGEAILMGDYNEVRTNVERRGTCFNVNNASFFNQFISSSGLVDIKMEGYTFTWSHPSAEKMSKLDRFLVSDGILTIFPSISALCLDRHLSDHRPILLCEVKVDFGPIPFRFYHSWFKLVGFDDMVEQTWRALAYSDNNKMIRFKKKLQELKKVIRLWVNDKKIQSAGSKNSIVSELRDIDKRLDQYGPIDSLIFRRQDLMSNLNDLKEMEDMDFVQKAKVRWAIEGDENSKYFHGIINKKRSNLAIRGVFVDGTWCTDPILVKKAFKDHYEARFNKPTKARLKLSFSFPNRLSTDQVADLERHVSHDEIRLAVWDCGVNKSPGPDGFTFEFFRKFWKVIGPDFCEAVEHFFKQGSFSKGCNSSFIALIPKVLDAKFVNDYRPISLIGCIYKVVTKILASRLAMVIAGLVSNTQSAFVAGRQILDGPFILNEVLDWCKRKKKKALFFKVDFAKAYDSVRWDFLLDVLEAFGFGSTWCTWIRGISDFAKASLLVNGSPSDEFHIHRGLKQGDPLSPFLFILVMEALHLSVCKAVDEDVFKGIQLQEFRVIQAVHGDKIDSHSVRKVSIWSSILKEVQVLKSSGFDFLSHCSKRIGDGEFSVEDTRLAIDDLGSPLIMSPLGGVNLFIYDNVFLCGLSSSGDVCLLLDTIWAKRCYLESTSCYGLFSNEEDVTSFVISMCFYLSDGFARVCRWGEIDFQLPGIRSQNGTSGSLSIRLPGSVKVFW
ncbi:RNA-directed DNA polymerase, eukaryota [Tanacetum coccineum]